MPHHTFAGFSRNGTQAGQLAIRLALGLGLALAPLVLPAPASEQEVGQASCRGADACTGNTGRPSPHSNPPVPLGTPLRYAPAAKGFGYPASEETLADYLARLDVRAMRAHAWDDWAALTSRIRFRIPIMLTWYQNREIFGTGTIDHPRRLYPQFLTGPRDSLGDGNPPISFNVYDRSYRSHVRANGYEWRNTLTALVGHQPSVVDFPAEAIAVKTVWWPVRHDGPTAFPVWDGAPTRPIEWGTGIGLLVDEGYFGPLTPEQQAELKRHEKHGNEWGTFRRVVAIDPRAIIPVGETTTITFFDPDDLQLQRHASRRARVVPLGDFFHVRLNDTATLHKLNAGLAGQIAERFWGRPLGREDYLALVAVHVTTREAPDWVWLTLWWHDDPDAAPYGNDRPRIVKFPFDRFRMEVAQSADVPVAPDGTPHITFNPYLEAGFALGVWSNCIGCHQRAAWTATGPGEVYPVKRGSMLPNDPFFAGKVRTHFLWSLVFRPRPLPGSPGPGPTECPRGRLCD
jgi:hypothetical protein